MKITYKPGDFAARQSLFMKMTASREAPTKPVVYDNACVYVWGSNTKRASGAAIFWAEIIHLAIVAAANNTAVRDDLRNAIEALVDIERSSTWPPEWSKWRLTGKPEVPQAHVRYQREKPWGPAIGWRLQGDDGIMGEVETGPMPERWERVSGGDSADAPVEPA